jgi:hypothetical protein
VVGVSDCDGKGVRSVRAGALGPGQKPRDHRVHLRLFGVSVADDRFLDEPSRIFSHLDPGPRGSHYDDPARLAEFQCRLRVGIDKDFLDGSAIRPVLGEERFELGCKIGKASGKRSRGARLYLAVAEMTQPISLRLDQSPTGRAQPGIEAEDDQPSFSNSSSGTS